MSSKFGPYDMSPPAATCSRCAKLVGSRFFRASCAIFARSRKMTGVVSTKSASARARIAMRNALSKSYEGFPKSTTSSLRPIDRFAAGEPRSHAETERHRPGLAPAQAIRARGDEHGAERQMGLDRPEARGARRGG